MIRALLLILSILLAATVSTAKVRYPGPKTYVYRYYLHDKQGCGCTLNQPHRYLSQKAIERRRHQRLKVDSTDLPVSKAYIDSFRVKGVQILGASRWSNTVLASAEDTLLLSRLSALKCVREARLVFVSPDSIEGNPKPERPKIHGEYNRWDSLRGDPLGMARTQIEMLGGERLHEIDLRGQGMTVAVLDGGFQNADLIPCFNNTHIIGVQDFIRPLKGNRTPPLERPYTSIDHGTRVLSAMAAQSEEVMMGTAPLADYWLLRCEDPLTEQPIEEDYWTMAAEFADSVGADIISSSLGYNEYDADFGSYHLQDLDGHTALISQAASLLARKGIVLCCSAGNAGMKAWKKITVPADAEDILTIGAVDKDGRNAPFASVGPTQDGRVKPDVVAMGASTALISGRGTLVNDMGTSFSTPIVSGLVACLWQGLRHKTALEIINLVRQSASQYDTPDNILGYGIPNFWQAYLVGKMDTGYDTQND
ncbi:MAG: S8 family serine peptidase [Prevotella sp.]|nr:S8 family serine peptidase [Prevotella sp.]